VAVLTIPAAERSGEWSRRNRVPVLSEIIESPARGGEPTVRVVVLIQIHPK